MPKLSQNKEQNYLHGAAILTISIAIVKVLGFIYKIPLGNMLGDVGSTYFYVAYNMYNVLLTLSTAGLPVALSKMVSEANTLNRPVQVKRIFRVALSTFIALGAAGSLVMFIFPTELASIMGSMEAAQSIFALAPAVVLVCVLSAYRGYIQGHSNMTPTSVSQVIEVGVKVIFGLALAWMLSRQGKDLSEISAAATSGVAVGAFAACAYVFVKKGQFERTSTKPSANLDIPEHSSVIFSRLLKIGIPIALGSSILSIITLIDTKLVLNRLQFAAGFSKEHTDKLFGTYSMATPICNLPSAFIQTLTISIVPALASCLAAKKINEAKAVTESSLRMAAIVAMPMCVGFAVLSDPIMNVLYYGKISPEGPELLASLGIASFFVCMTLMTNAILQAYGAERLTLISMLVGGAVKIGVNWVLVANPGINIHGAPVGTLCCYIIMCAMNYIFLSQRMAEPPRLSRIIARPAISSALMGAAALLVYTPLSAISHNEGGLGRMQMAVVMFIAIVVAVAVYLISVIATRALTKEDLLLMPKGDKLVKLLRLK